MKSSWSSILRRHVGRHLIEVRSRIKGVGRTAGFVVDFSDELILFHVVERDTFRLNGYRVIRNDDIKDYRLFDSSDFWQWRAVRHFKLAPVRPDGISVVSVRELLSSVARRYPLACFHPEKRNPDVCYIGPVISMTAKTFTIDDLDCNAEWTGPRRLKFEDVTRIEFGGGYEEALAVTAPKRRPEPAKDKRKRRKKVVITAVSANHTIDIVSLG